MSFRFKKNESLNKAVRRLCRERIAQARRNLKNCKRAEALHNARKEIKKLRAVLRLARGDIGKNIYHEETKALRRAANGLAGARDARVQAMTFENLRADFQNPLAAKPFEKIGTMLRENCRKQIQRFQKDKPSVNRVLRKMKQRAGDLKIKAEGWPAIEPGLKQSYRRSRKMFETARQHPLPENFHEWRKRVKDLDYQLRLLRPIQPTTLRVAIAALEKLGELLGDDHDLALLKQFIAHTQKLQNREIAALNDLIDSRQKELRFAAEKIGSHFFAEKPSPFCARLKNYWDHWRGD
jgi:CHAD domain-containing protein